MTRQRQEFDRATKAEIMRRCKAPTGFRCEKCGAIVTKGDIDHIIPDALIVKKRKLTAADGQFLCEPCHDGKTPGDVAVIAKAKRQEARDLGIVPPPAQKMQSRPFQKRERASKIGAAKIEKHPLPPRGIYE